MHEYKDEKFHIEVDQVNHPTHYTSHPSGIEAIQVTRHMNFNLGNAMKYIWRAESKMMRSTLKIYKKQSFILMMK